MATATANKKASSANQVKDGLVKVEGLVQIYS